jgi:hypothetical protein
VNARFNEEDWWAPLHAASSQGYRKLVAGAVSAQLLLQSLRTMFNTPVAVFEIATYTDLQHLRHRVFCQIKHIIVHAAQLDPDQLGGLAGRLRSGFC